MIYLWYDITSIHYRNATMAAVQTLPAMRTARIIAIIFVVFLFMLSSSYAENLDDIVFVFFRNFGGIGCT